MLIKRGHIQWTNPSLPFLSLLLLPQFQPNKDKLSPQGCFPTANWVLSDLFLFHKKPNQRAHRTHFAEPSSSALWLNSFPPPRLFFFWLVLMRWPYNDLLCRAFANKCASTNLTTHVGPRRFGNDLPDTPRSESVTALSRSLSQCETVCKALVKFVSTISLWSHFTKWFSFPVICVWM